MSPVFSKIAIVGAGSVGGYYGARLARAGAEVHFLMRSDLAAARAGGLRVQAPDGEFVLQPVQAHATTATIGTCDLVVIGLKATANAELGRLLPPLLHGRTTLLTLQNGLGCDEEIAAHFGAERVVGGLCFVCINRIAPAFIRCTSFGRVTLGELGRPAGERVAALAALFSRAGVKTNVVDRLDEARWRKLAWNVPFNGLAIAGGGIATDKIMGDEALRERARRLMEEVIAAAAQLGFQLPADLIEMQMRDTAAMEAYKPSSLVDYLAGRPVEVEAIWGEPLRRAKAAGVAVPELERLYGELTRLCAR